MLDELHESDVQNIDGLVNITPIQPKIYHWTELKSSTYSPEYSMIFSEGDIPHEQWGGMWKTLSCCLASAQTALGEKATSRIVHFDKNYIKFQIATLLRDVLFVIDDSDRSDFLESPDEQFEALADLIFEALRDFRKAHDACIDNPVTAKGIKPKTVTQYLKEVVYKP